VLRAKFAGQPEHVINFLFMVAEEMRQYMSGECGSRHRTPAHSRDRGWRSKHVMALTSAAGAPAR
jgi:glutamate synthase domain-containing protein 2